MSVWRSERFWDSIVILILDLLPRVCRWSTDTGKQWSSGIGCEGRTEHPTSASSNPGPAAQAKFWKQSWPPACHNLLLHCAWASLRSKAHRHHTKATCTLAKALIKTLANMPQPYRGQAGHSNQQRSFGMRVGLLHIEPKRLQQPWQMTAAKTTLHLEQPKKTHGCAKPEKEIQGKVLNWDHRQNFLRMLRVLVRGQPSARPV